MALIYLDICCLNRPFDDQTQLLIRLQTEAKLFDQEAIRKGEHTLVWSAVLDLENRANPDIERRHAVQAWRSFATVEVEVTPRVEALAEMLAGQGIKPMDALHVASAIEAGAVWLLTTDRALLRETKDDDRVNVSDPVDFIRYLQGSEGEN